ncbi:DUF6301 family protein [Kitasatospora sp. KL5]|uniref:DUF6301 family protein n=1 Tax=Kitasatospora sp. KL5 TaxID=3425125 RepID=UPI003D6EED43
MISSEDIGSVVRRLTAGSVGPGWSERDMRALVDRLGWTWVAEPDGRVRVLTGLPGGDAELVPVDARARTYAPTQAYLELVVPVSRPAPEVRPQAEEFRRVADAVRQVCGEATYAGAAGFHGPAGFRMDPVWGRPFLRWRQGEVTVELRAGAAGPELVLQSSEVWESWFALAGEGFVGVLEGERPLDHPRWEGHGTWEDLELSLGGFLRTLAAETVATGIVQSMPLYGRLAHDNSGPLLFSITCTDRLYVDYTEYRVPEAASGANAAALGWTPREALPTGHLPADLDGAAPWRIDAGGPGDLQAGTAIASLIVRTARAAGVESHSDLLLGGEAEFRHPYRIGFPGLRMTVV